MNRIEKLARLTVILVLLVVVRINYQLSIPGDGDIEEYGFRTTETHLPGGDQKFERVAYSGEAIGGL